jgi:hypothetical protein
VRRDRVCACVVWVCICSHMFKSTVVLVNRRKKKTTLDNNKLVFFCHSSACIVFFYKISWTKISFTRISFFITNKRLHNPHIKVMMFTRMTIVTQFVLKARINKALLSSSSKFFHPVISDVWTHTWSIKYR